MLKRIVALFSYCMAAGVQGASVLYDFDSGTNAAVSGPMSVSPLAFVHGLNSESNAPRNVQRAWYSGDLSGDDVLYVSGRSSDNKGTESVDLDMNSGAPSYFLFSVSPESGQALDFSEAELGVNAILYNDSTSTFEMAYQVWAQTGGVWFAVDSSTMVDGNGSGNGTGTVFEVNETTELVLGNDMDAGTVEAISATLAFDLSSVGVLGLDQTVEFAVALSGTRDNQNSFNSAVDDLVVTISEDGNQAPTAVGDAYSLIRGETLMVAAPGVLMNDLDEEGDAMSVHLVSDVTSGVLMLQSDGSFDYTPEVGFSGTAEFAYAAIDIGATGRSAVVSIQVTEPIAVERPNILIFFADDMGIGDSRVYNETASLPPAMPTVEQFAADGMVFNDAHTQAALCAPSRYSILTGNYPWRGRKEGGSWHFNTDSQFMTGQRTVGHVLQDAGYKTAIFGKGHLGGLSIATNGVPDMRDIVWDGSDVDAYLGGDDSVHADYYDPLAIDWSLPLSKGVNEQGFDYSYMLYGGIQDPLYAYFENDYLVGNPDDLELFNNPHYMTDNGDHWIYRRGYGLPGWYTCDVGPTLTQKTLDYIDAHVATNQAAGTDHPFFIHYCSQAVHSKHTPPNDFLGTAVAGTTGSAHSDMLFELEVAFSNILAKLESQGLLDDTLVIFTSDNGGLGINESGSSHNPNEGLRGYKASIWEGGHRVPLFVKWGDRIPAGSYDHMVGVHDLYATIAQLVGKAQGDGQGLDSVSFLSVLLSGNQAPVRDHLLCRGNSINKGLQDVDPVSFTGRAVREGTYKLITDMDGNPLYLYELSGDPKETDDLLSDPAQAARVARMGAKMDEYVSMVYDHDHPSIAPRSEPLPPYRDLNINGMDDDWEVYYFGSTNAVNGGAEDDFDGDGIVNLQEFLFGSNPIVADDPKTVLPVYRIVGDDFKYVYRRRQDAAAYNLSYTPEQIDNLISNGWNSEGLAVTGTEFLDAGVESVTNLYSMTGTTNRFFRLKISSE